MKFKDRLDILNEYNSLNNITLKNDIDITNIFLNNPKAEKIVKSALRDNKNIILICPDNYDKSVLSSYIRGFINNKESQEVIRNIADNYNYLSASKIIVPEPTIKDIVKIEELILTGINSFIFAMNIKSFDNVLKSIIAITSLSFPYLSEESVKHLLYSTEAVIIFFTGNEDGLYYIHDIGQINYSSDSESFDILYKFNKNDLSEQKINQPKKEKTENLQPETKKQTKQKKKDETKNESENIIKEEKEITTKENKEINIEKKQTIKQDTLPVLTTNKINKYKLLKLKYKKKINPNSELI